MKSLWNKLHIKWNQLKQKPWHEILDRHFDAIAFLKQDGEEKKEISIQITEGVNHGRIYWLELSLAGLIATFGLFQNSVAIIIGAMLIAPVMRPIQAMAFGIALGRMTLFGRAVKLLLLSILVGIVIGYLVTNLSPIGTETSEILARTNPNLFDLFIALASSVVAFLALGFRKLLEGIAGVAMATSLMPPLVVVGIEIAFGAFEKAWGSFLLFSTNLGAILLVGTTMFFLYGFNPHQEEITKTVKRFGMILTMMLILWVTLFSSLLNINNQRDITQSTKEILQQELLRIDSNSSVREWTLLQFGKHEVSFQGEITIAEGAALPKNFLPVVMEKASRATKKKIGANINIIRTSYISTSDQN